MSRAVTGVVRARPDAPPGAARRLRLRAHRRGHRACAPAASRPPPRRGRRSSRGSRRAPPTPPRRRQTGQAFGAAGPAPRACAFPSTARPGGSTQLHPTPRPWRIGPAGRRSPACVAATTMVRHRVVTRARRGEPALGRPRNPRAPPCGPSGPWRSATSRQRRARHRGPRRRTPAPGRRGSPAGASCQARRPRTRSTWTSNRAERADVFVVVPDDVDDRARLTEPQVVEVATGDLPARDVAVPRTPSSSDSTDGSRASVIR
jgi:hypothetical protein